MQFFNIVAFCVLFVVSSAQQDLAGLFKSQTNLSDFTALLEQYPALYQNISSTQGITIFAPSNEAFAKVNYTVLAPAFSSHNDDFIKALLQYHVATGVHPSGSLTGNFQFLPTMLDNQTYENVTGGQVIAAVRQGGDVFVGVSGFGSRSTLTTVDLQFNNGVVHIVDTMFIPPQDFITSAPAFNLSAFPGALFTGPPIILNYTNINPSLTVFAPYNLAFQRIESSLENLSVEDITALLEYHLVPSNSTPYYSSNLPNGLPYSAENSSIFNQTTLKSLQGNDLSITFEYNSLFVNQARIIQSDLLLSNGVLHVIDSVLNPNNTSIAPVPTATTPIEAYQASSTGKGLPFTQALPTTTSELFSLVTETPSSTIPSGPPGSTATEGGTLHSSVALGDRVMVGKVEMGWLFGVAVWILGFL